MRRKNSLIPEKYMLLNWGGVYMLLEYNNNIHDNTSAFHETYPMRIRTFAGYMPENRLL